MRQWGRSDCSFPERRFFAQSVRPPLEASITRLWLILTLVLMACSPKPPAELAIVLDSLVPGVHIGARAAPVARRLGLHVAPYVGYGDSAFRSAYGIHGLWLQVNQSFGSEGDRPSWWARIAEVSIGIDSVSDALRVSEMLTRHLGQPEPWCYVRGDEVQVRIYFWPYAEDLGVLMAEPVGAGRHPLLTFGRERPDSNRSDPTRCSTDSLSY